ncbi:MAG TPA: cell division protein SepF [Acidimicrobiales bacterium]|jgi:cell division inhibitor SepF|nr:cell division protein SepF [Acidimicrobiales bacterium]
MFKKLMLYLGLGPDEAYEEFMDNSVERRPLLSSGDFLEERGATENDQMHSPQSSLGQSSIRPLTPESSGTVRPLQPAATSKPHHVEAKVFDDAVEIGDRFLAAQPVVIDFQGVDAELSRRLMDFASGVCYASGGSMKKVGTQVYLMTPNDVEVSDEDLKGYET